MLELRNSALLLVAALLLPACKGTEPVQRTTEGGAPLPLVVSGALVETDEAPSDDSSVELALEQLIQQSRIEAGVRVVEFQLRNRSEQELAFAFRVEWLDRRGAPVVDRRARWSHLVLPAGAIAPLRIQAPSAKAESWRLRAVADPGE